MTKPVIFVHGFNFDPDKPGDDNPHDTVYREWRQWFPRREVVEFSYYSGAGGFRALLRAARAGYRGVYRWAYSKLAVDAAEKLFQQATDIGPCDVVCHSLGTRVVLDAAARGAPFERVVMLGGAETVPVAQQAALDAGDTQFLNVMSTTDDILDILGEHFSPGDSRSVIGADGIPGIPNVKNVVLDDEEVQHWATAARNWYLNGDMDNIWDHHVYYRWTGNWDLYLTWINGDDLGSLPDNVEDENNDFFD